MATPPRDAHDEGRIHLSLAQVTEVEERFVLDALRSGWVAPLGPHVDAFEHEMAERVGVNHALALSSGTAALHLALLELGAGPGRVVVLPSMTFAASANAVTYTGATPVFVDSCEEDGNVSPSLLAEALDALLAEGTDVAAVMTVDLFGRAADYTSIQPLLAEREVPLVEDAAEALGASHGDRAAGSFGRVAALSFNGNKILTTSGGGMLLTDDTALADHARKLSTQAREPVGWYEHLETGFNYRMSNLLAALGRGQLTRLDEMITRRHQIREQYRQRLSDTPGLTVLGGDDTGADNCWLTCLVLDREHYPYGATEMIEALNSQDIDARYLWKPMHKQPLFAGARSYIDGTAERLFAQGITLPSGSGLSTPQVDRVAESVIAASRAGHRVLT